MTDRELMQQALEALELLARCEHPLTKIQVRKPRDGGSIVTVYPHQVATDAAEQLRERLAQPADANPDPLHLSRILHELAGAASMCWSPRPSGVFDSQEAIQHVEAAIAEIRERLAQPEQERGFAESLAHQAVLRREWQGLTEEEIKSLPQWFPSHETAAVLPLIRAIEAKLKEKNNG